LEALYVFGNCHILCIEMITLSTLLFSKSSIIGNSVPEKLACI